MTSPTQYRIFRDKSRGLYIARDRIAGPYVHTVAHVVGSDSEGLELVEQARIGRAALVADGWRGRLVRRLLGEADDD